MPYKKTKKGPAPGTIFSQVKRHPLGEKLLALRRERGLSQNDLAQKTGLTKRMVSFYERESENIPAPKLELIAKALNVSIDDIMGYTPDKKNIHTSKALLKRIEILKSLTAEKQKIISDLIDQLAKKSDTTNVKGS